MSQELEERIRQRAYDIWEREGYPVGRDLEHWACAAQELLNEDRDEKNACQCANGGECSCAEGECNCEKGGCCGDKEEKCCDSEKPKKECCKSASSEKAKPIAEKKPRLKKTA